MASKWPARILMAGGVLAACAVSALTTWILLRPDPLPHPGVSQPAPPSKEEKKAGPKVQVALKKPIKAIPPKAKAPLGLPADVQADPKQHLLATAHFNAEARPYTVSALLNEGTGDTSIYVRPDPKPWLAFEDTGAVGIAYVVREDGERVGMLHGRLDVLRMKDFHIGALGHVDTGKRAVVGVNFEWRF